MCIRDSRDSLQQLTFVIDNLYDLDNLDSRTDSLKDIEHTLGIVIGLLNKMEDPSIQIFNDIQEELQHHALGEYYPNRDITVITEDSLKTLLVNLKLTARDMSYELES